MKKRSLIAAIVTFSVSAIIFTACGSKPADIPSSAAPDKTSAPAVSEELKTELSAPQNGYTFTVLDECGNPVSGAVVQICSETQCVQIKTDDSGIAFFKAEPGVYDIHILKAPEEFLIDIDCERTTPDVTEITITLKKA